MKTNRILWTSALGALLLAVVPGYAQAPRERQLFDNGWRFHLGDVTQGQATTLADKDWRAVDLPHDWSIEGPFDQKNASGRSTRHTTKAKASRPTSQMMIREYFMPLSARGLTVGPRLGEHLLQPLGDAQEFRPVAQVGHIQLSVQPDDHEGIVPLHLAQ